MHSGPPIGLRTSGRSHSELIEVLKVVPDLLHAHVLDDHTR